MRGRLELDQFTLHDKNESYNNISWVICLSASCFAYALHPPWCTRCPPPIYRTFFMTLQSLSVTLSIMSVGRLLNSFSGPQSKSNTSTAVKWLPQRAFTSALIASLLGNWNSVFTKLYRLFRYLICFIIRDNIYYIII